MPDPTDPNLGTSVEDRKKIDSYYKSFKTPRQSTSSSDEGRSCTTSGFKGDYTATPDTDFMFFHEQRDPDEIVHGLITATNVYAGKIFFEGFSFEITNEGLYSKLTITLEKDLTDLDIELKTKGRIVDVSTLINTER